MTNPDQPLTDPRSLAASALGRLARGVPKQFSPDELARRTIRIAEVNKKARERRERMKQRAQGILVDDWNVA
jgi:hypothetical protein